MHSLALKMFNEKAGRKAALRWPLLHELLDAGFFAQIDLIFAERLLANADEQQAAVICALMRLSRLGHLCLCVDDCGGDRLAGLVKAGAAKMPEELVEEINGNTPPYPIKPICRVGNFFYLQKSWLFESRFINHLERLKDQQFEELTFEPDDKLTGEQCEAVKMGLRFPLSIITGGPGTGKTYTASRIVHAFLKQKPDAKIILTAPTGKAAEELKKNLGHAGFLGGTLHALLRIRPDTDYTVEPKPLEVDLIIVDECSMIDARLFCYFLAAVKEGTRVILMGDPDQLPPVESGSLFADLVSICQYLPIAILTRSLRSEKSEILEVSAAVKNGDVSSVFSILRAEQHAVRYFSWDLSREESYGILFEHIEKRYNPEEIHCFRLLSCLRKGPFGVDALNRMIADRFAGASFFPILITENDSETGLSNGETGILFPAQGFALFPKLGKIPALFLPCYEYAYCLSVHKSQGSEYDTVLLLVPPGSEVFGREILYTGITRAKKALEIAGDEKTIQMTLEARARKISGFHARLRL